MTTARLIMEGTDEQAQIVSYVLSQILSDVAWKPTIYYSIDDQQLATINQIAAALHDVWWPAIKGVLKKHGTIDGFDLNVLLERLASLNASLEDVLGRETVQQILEPVDNYFVCGRFPVEWIMRDGLPLSLYAPLYRFSRAQHILSLNAPLEQGTRVFLAPKYTDAKYAGMNSAVADSALFFMDAPSVTVIDGTVNLATIRTLQSAPSQSITFHGHANQDGVVGSDGITIPYGELVKAVSGSLFLLGCSTGGFESGTLHKVADFIPVGLHGAVQCTFRSPANFTALVNESIFGTFRGGDVRRVQDIAHMARLAIAYLALVFGVRCLSGVKMREKVMIISPFEADYEKFTSWGSGVSRLREELNRIPDANVRNVLRAIAAGLSMGVISCGTPVFLLPDADPRLVNAFKQFINWEGSTA